MTKTFVNWFVAIRGFSFVTTIIPISLGAVLSLREGYLSIPLYLITLLGGLSLHGGTNLINDYYDYKNGIDDKDSHESSKIIYLGIIPLEKFYSVGVFLLIFGMIIGIILSLMKGVTVALLGAIGAIGGYYYTANPINLKYKGLGLPVVFLLMGPMMVFGSYFVQTMNYNYSILWFSIPIGLLVAAILQSNDIRDLEDDKRSGIRTLSVRVGRKKSILLFYLLIYASYILILTIIIMGLASKWMFLIFLTIPAGKNLIINMVKNVNSREKNKCIVPLTAKFYTQFGFILIIILLIR